MNIWTKRISRNLRLANLARDAGLNKLSSDLMKCGSFVNTVGTVGHKKHYAFRMVRCHSRFCSLCEAIEARNRSQMLQTVLYYLLTRHYGKNNVRRYDIIFITLTTPNVAPTIKAVAHGYHQIEHYKHNFLYNKKVNGWSKHSNGILKGAISKFEFVPRDYNINLHIHICGLVRKSYFNKHLKYHKNLPWFDKIWRDSCDKHKYNIFVKRGYCKGRDGKCHFLSHHVTRYSDNIANHMGKELGKYTGKSSDMLHNFQGHSIRRQKIAVKQFRAIVRGLKGTHVLTFYGQCRKAHHLYLKEALVQYYPIDKNVYVWNDKYKYDYTKKDFEMSSSKINNYIYARLCEQSVKLGITLQVRMPNGKILRTNSKLIRKAMKEIQKEKRILNHKVINHDLIMHERNCKHCYIS